MAVTAAARAALALLGLCALCGLPHLALAGNSKENRNATTLNKDTLDGYLASQVEKQRPALVMFHVNWCKICHKTFPKFAATSDVVIDMDIAMDFAHVDCSDDKTLCQRFDVKGYPTIKLFTPEAGAEPLGYRGLRTEEGFLKYAQRMTLPPVRRPGSRGELADILFDEPFAAFIALAPADRKEIPAGFLAVAEKWMDRHIFAVAPHLEDLLPEGTEIPAGATLAVLSTWAQQWDGAGSRAKARNAASFTDLSLEDTEAVGAWVERSRFPGVWRLGDGNFYQFTHASKDAVIVVVDPEEVSPQEEKTIRKVAAKVEGDFLVGIMDGMQDSWAEELAYFNIYKKRLPRVLVSTEDFKAWYEDVEELTLDTLEEDLQGLRSGSKRLLKQGRGVQAKLLFYKREIWRAMVWLHSFSQQGPLEALLALGMVILGTLGVMVAGWCVKACCGAMLADEEGAFEAAAAAAASRAKAKPRSKKDD